MKLIPIKPGAWTKLQKDIARHAKNEPKKSDQWLRKHAL